MKRFGISVLLALLAVCLIATPVYADTLDPVPDPTIEEINIYRNLLETGDWLLVAYANIPYAVTPDTPMTQTFIWQLIAVDGVTELGSTIGNNYNITDGFGYNVYSMYWTAAEATALGMVWNTIYTLRLSGNPAVFVTPPVYNFPLNITDYSLLTATADVQAELAARILTIATDLNSKWGLLPTFLLLKETEAGTALSTFGEAFFRQAIYGLQAMAPAAFSVVLTVMDIPSRNWSTEYSGNLTNQWDGTWAETSIEAGKALFGTEYDLLSIIMLLGMSGGLMIGNVMLTGDHWNGFIDVAILGVIGARLGMYDLGFLMLVAALCWLYISAKIWFGLFR